jgi:hypothetical protein
MQPGGLVMKPAAGWTTYGTGRAAFPLFQGVARSGLNDSFEFRERLKSVPHLHLIM